MNEVEVPKTNQNMFKRWLQILARPFMELFYRFDRKMDGAATFFVRHYGKTRFMVAMSKRLQVMGLERLWEKGPKAFLYFFLFYLIRDTILYIIIPIWVARMTSSN